MESTTLQYIGLYLVAGLIFLQVMLVREKGTHQKVIDRRTDILILALIVIVWPLAFALVVRENLVEIANYKLWGGKDE